MLAGKRLVVTGVVTRDSIAYEVACHALIEVLWQRDEHFGTAGA